MKEIEVEIKVNGRRKLSLDIKDLMVLIVDEAVERGVGKKGVSVLRDISSEIVDLLKTFSHSL